MADGKLDRASQRRDDFNFENDYLRRNFFAYRLHDVPVMPSSKTRTCIYSSAWGTPSYAVTVEDGQIAWAGLIAHLNEAGAFDAVFCHTDDEARLRQILRTRGIRNGHSRAK